MAQNSRRAKIELLADAKRLDPGLFQAKSKLAAFGRSASRVLARGFAAANRHGGTAATAVGAGVLGFVGSQVDDVIDYERAIARLAIAQGKGNSAMETFRADVARVSDETGIARNEIMKGVTAYQALSGDTEGATRAMATFARVAHATGSSVEEIATAADALTKIGVPAAELEAMFGILNTQGKAGAIELRDLAAELSSITPQFLQFAGAEGKEGGAVLGAALQTIRRGFGSASEAGTGMRATMTAIVRNASKLQKAGVQIFTKDPKTGKKNLREFSDIIESIAESNLIKDPEKLQKALGSDEAARGVLTLTRYLQDFKGLIASGGEGSIARDSAQMAESTAGKLEKAWNRAKNAAAGAITPELIESAAAAMGSLSAAVNVAADGFERLKGVGQWLAGNEQRLLGDAPDVEMMMRQNEQRTGKALWRRSEGIAGEAGQYDLGASAAAVERVFVTERAKANQRVDGGRAGLVRGQAPLAAAVAGVDLRVLEAAIARALQVKVAVNVAGSAVFDAVAENPRNRTRAGGR